MSTKDQDVADILKVHHAWLESNNGLVESKMYPNFANPGYLQYNLNGHTYTSVDEKVKIWHFHASPIAPPDTPRFPQDAR